MKKNIIAIIPARGGSKAIPQKNIVKFCGKPLIAWTIEHALQNKYIHGVYVSTNDEKIAEISKKYGAEIIWRPAKIATDTSSSEEALSHAIAIIEKKKKIDLVLFYQATSPLRDTDTTDKALESFYRENADSLFTAAKLEDEIWEVNNGKFKSITFNYKNRGRRQDRTPTYLENGSIYIFKPEVIKKYHNRFGGKIAVHLMPFWQSYEIDNLEDLEICEYYMRNKILKMFTKGKNG